ncbi:DUF4148 domain-containing protein [Paraburkholderia lacunae]|uniref:DUF4148 domain-containing protein n=1 Tax=Paraburkholderia lacunae TaxID=2211104 RepID=A0A370N5S0_9BURK|nr:DUF4148 domain-containing protein [Paraburkholderia lacunae]RDK00895.1 DUF4148 domain-containing protein [Paraburkholderia lacunae]
MKFLTAVALAALSLPFGANAFAQTSTPGLTRAEVRAQLVEAQADGLVPSPRNDYPPSAQTIARNREIYAIQHQESAGTASASASAPRTSGAAAD